MVLLLKNKLTLKKSKGENNKEIHPGQHNFKSPDPSGLKCLPPPLGLTLGYRGHGSRQGTGGGQVWWVLSPGAAPHPPPGAPCPVRFPGPGPTPARASRGHQVPSSPSGSVPFGVALASCPQGVLTPAGSCLGQVLVKSVEPVSQSPRIPISAPPQGKDTLPLAAFSPFSTASHFFLS